MATAREEFEALFLGGAYDAETEPKDIPWIAEGLWKAGKFNGIFGLQKSGKSRWFTWMLASVFCGQPNRCGLILHPENFPKRWLWLSGEEDHEEVWQRLRGYVALLGGEFSEDFPLCVYNTAGLGIDSLYRRDLIERFMVEEGFDALLLDPLRRLHNADGDSNTAMASIYSDFLGWNQDYEWTIFLLHHPTKAVLNGPIQGRMEMWSSGAGDLTTALECATFVHRVDPVRRLVDIYSEGRFSPVETIRLYDGGDLGSDGPQEGWRLATEEDLHGEK